MTDVRAEEQRPHRIAQRLRLISDFNIELLGRSLANLREFEGLEISAAPFGQVYQSLAGSSTGASGDEVAVVWTRPESILPSYGKALEYQLVDHDAVLDEVTAYARWVTRYASQARYLFHPSWTLPSANRGYGMIDYAPGIGLSHLLARMNLRLAECVGDARNVFILNTEQWLRHAGARASIPKMWFATKVPFKNIVFEEAASDIAAAMLGLAGKSRKLLLVDLDDTLWGGVVGETGWRGLQLGGHDHIGEAFVDFQRTLKSLSNKGVQLGIVSKNNEAVALEAIDCHPEMQLSRADFAGWRINWDDKATNIVELADELRLGLESIVFIDDSAVERGRVRDALGGRVLVPDWPADPTEFSAAVSELRCFDVPTITKEDRARAGMYAAERERRLAAENVRSLDDWLEALQIEVRAERLSSANLVRASQLFNKTNQINLSTRRLSQDELTKWSEARNRAMWTFRVSDRYGDSGLTGLISTESEGDTIKVVDFLMSCRVMGRHIEEAMVFTAVEHARKQKGARRVLAEFIPTERNQPCLDFWRRSGFEERGGYQFCWEPLRSFPAPQFVKLIGAESEADLCVDASGLG
jgi:FkbH-like protein